MQGRLERLPQVLVLLRGEDVRLVDDRATDRVPELERPVGGDDAHRAGAVGIDELVPAHADDVEERARLDEAAGEVEDDPRLLPRAGGAEDVRRVAPGQELVEARARPRAGSSRSRAARRGRRGDRCACPPRRACRTRPRRRAASPRARTLARPPVPSYGRSWRRRSRRPRRRRVRSGSGAAFVPRASFASWAKAMAIEALLVGRGRRPVGRLQPGELGIIDERAEEKAGVAVGAEAAVAQMLLQGFGRARHSVPKLSA